MRQLSPAPRVALGHASLSLARRRSGPGLLCPGLVRFCLLGFCLLGIGAPPLPAAEPDSAHALLQSIRSTYGAAAAVEDGGQIEIIPSDGHPRRLSWALASTAEGFLLRLRPLGGAGATEERVIWREDDGSVHVWDRGLGLRRRVESLPAAVAGSIGLGGFEALALPLYLAGSEEALADPEGAALEGRGLCGDGAECRILYLARMAGDLESWLWVDEAALVHRLEVVRHQGDGTFLRIRVDHSPRLGEASDTGFTPPETTRIAAAGEWPGPIDEAAISSFGEEITVQLLTASLRVVDRRGNPRPGLGPDDFRVLVEGEEVELTAVDWVPARRPTGAADSVGAHLGEGTDPALEEPSVLEEPAARQARPVVLFVQADFHAIRIKGHLKFLPFVEELLDELGAGERVAVVSFDSHLKLWSDFTADREATLEAVRNAIRFGNLPELRRSRGSGPSLAAALDLRAAQEAATPEAALTVVGQALGAIDGVKDLIFLGWGLGRWTSFGMRMDFGPPVAALRASQTTVYVLDVTDADLHTLEMGLQSVATRTGGTYAKTNRFGAQAVRNLLRALSGHYVLTLDRSRLPAGRSELTIELRDPEPGIRILGDPRFVDRP